MTIKTGRADQAAQITIDRTRCNNCGLCAEVCKGAPLIMESGELVIDQARFFGCIGCGHCMSVCPQDCIRITGRDMSYEDIIPMPPSDRRAGYDQLLALLLSRRSIRNFKDRPVEPELIERIITAVSTAPMGLPPSDVEVLVFDSRDKVGKFASDIIAVAQKSQWMFSPLVTALFRPFLGREYAESVETFIRPALKTFIEEKAKGKDYLLYDAPLAMFFHCSPYADPADPLVAATYAMLAGEALGLGSCMIGTPGYFIKYSRELKRKYAIPARNQAGIVVIFGYPKIRFARAIKRRLARITLAP